MLFCFKIFAGGKYFKSSTDSERKFKIYITFLTLVFCSLLVLIFYEVKMEIVFVLYKYGLYFRLKNAVGRFLLNSESSLKFIFCF